MTPREAAVILPRMFVVALNNPDDDPATRSLGA